MKNIKITKVKKSIIGKVCVLDLVSTITVTCPLFSVPDASLGRQDSAGLFTGAVQRVQIGLGQLHLQGVQWRRPGSRGKDCLKSHM
jgi:hypothetical protein